MKKLNTVTAFILAAALLSGCAAAGGTVPAATDGPTETGLPAETEAPTQTTEPAATEPPVMWAEVDVSSGTGSTDAFPGDGVIDEVRIATDENAYTTTFTFVDDGVEYTHTLTDTALSNIGCCYGDTTAGDGYVEVYITGDVCSSDYYTFVYRVQDGRLLFCQYYGTVTGVDGSGFADSADVINVFGTYVADCRLQFNSDFTFTRVSNYTLEPESFTDEYSRALTVARDGLPVTDEATGASETLAAGTKLALTETDAETYAVMLTEDGSYKRLAITQGDDWGWYIDGVKEDEWFEEVWYAG